MKRTYVDAYVEWDDPEAFRVYLVPARPEDLDADESDPEPAPLEAKYTGPSIEARLYRAAFVKCAKDFAHLSVADRLGWPTEAPAKRVAKAVKAELDRIKRGEPGPTDQDVSWAAQIASIMTNKKRR